MALFEGKRIGSKRFLLRAFFDIADMSDRSDRAESDPSSEDAW